MPTLVNWELLRNPVNWVIVALMVLIGTFGLHLVMKPRTAVTVPNNQATI